ncbi:CHAT domain-containing protein [Acidovorax sp. Leaf160]|uniref:CHAT domain-containing protein n=1 Tax=Acidovorax sp. Leaf160 TaxID=1736280 RepID=UPI0006F2FFC3|nr:CHAT domain-containing protein [Acidovorax sp. Leaf160]KQR43085.1 hypothetical protein ASF94_11465 [Acidovorax sp. Leaf160]
MRHAVAAAAVLLATLVSALASEAASAPGATPAATPATTSAATPAPPPATTATRAEALLQRAAATLQGAPDPAAWDALRQARRLWSTGPGLTPRERALGLARAGQIASWLHAQRGQHERADAEARASLRIARQWLPPHGAEVLGARQVLFSHAVARQQWARARAELELLRPWLAADEACDDPLCANVLATRSRMHAAQQDLDAAYAAARAAHRFSLRTGEPHGLGWAELSLASLAQRLGRRAEERDWLQSVLQRADCGELPADHPAVPQARSAYQALLASDGGTAALEAARRQAREATATLQAREGLLSRDRAGLLLDRAALSHQAGDLDAARREAAEAWAIGWATQHVDTQWQAVERLVRLSQGRKAPWAEAAYGKMFVNTVQQQRAGLRSFAPDAQERFVQPRLPGYEELADALLRMQRWAEAEQVLSLVRSNAYHALVRSAPPPLTLPFTPGERPGQQRLAQAGQSLRQWHAQLQRTGRPADDATNARLQAELEGAVQALLDLARPPVGVQGGPGGPGAPGAASAVTRAALPPAPPPGGGITRVVYLPGPDALYIAVQSQGQATVREVAVSDADLLDHVAALRRALQNPGADPLPAAQALHALLWAPIADLVPTGDHAPPVRLRAEGVLRYLPFAVLHDGQRWLVEQATLSLDGGGALPDSGPPAPRSTAAPRQGWALLGASHGGGLPALPQVPHELRGLQQLAPGPAAATPLSLDERFTPERLRQALATRQVVHIASHFVLTPGQPAGGWLQLGNHRRLTLQALAGPAYRFDGLELLTLSACETALPSAPGTDDAPLESLAWLAHARGARNVLASLWAVPDAPTGQLMQRVYRQIAQGQPPAAALQRAQASLLTEPPPPGPGPAAARGLRPLAPDAATAEPRQRPPSLHPYYWGAFVVLSATQD